LELLRGTFGAKYFRLNKSKIEYIKCDFKATMQEEGMLDSMVKWYLRKTSFTIWD
jgi:hypothetical protein